MSKIYNLVMIDVECSYSEHIEAFNVGFFSDRDQAESTAKKYLRDINGFKDYNVTYQILEKNIMGDNHSDHILEIFIIYGWNENENMDEIDIIESDCYLNEHDAENWLKKLQLCHVRKEWCIDKYIINECYCKDGFVRV